MLNAYAKESNQRGVNGNLGDACLIPVDEPARQVTAPPEEEIRSPTKAAKKTQASVKEGIKSREPGLVNMTITVDAEVRLTNWEATVTALSVHGAPPPNVHQS